jgi:hypothetical protein
MEEEVPSGGVGDSDALLTHGRPNAGEGGGDVPLEGSRSSGGGPAKHGCLGPGGEGLTRPDDAACVEPCRRKKIPAKKSAFSRNPPLTANNTGGAGPRQKRAARRGPRPSDSDEAPTDDSANDFMPQTKIRREETTSGRPSPRVTHSASRPLE